MKIEINITLCVDKLLCYSVSVRSRERFCTPTIIYIMTTSAEQIFLEDQLYVFGLLEYQNEKKTLNDFELKRDECLNVAASSMVRPCTERTRQHNKTSPKK